MGAEVKRKYTVLSLFSGAMGLDLGIHLTKGFELVACVENESMYCKTIKENIKSGNLPKNLKVINKDISSIDPEELLIDLRLKKENIDVIIGGPPCQTFSTAGKRSFLEDARGMMLWQFLRFVKIIKPKFFLMENVCGLLSATTKDGKNVVELFTKELLNVEDANYSIKCFKVNSANYGAPQVRKRLIFIGNRFNVNTQFTEPTYGIGLKPWKTLGDAIGSLKNSEDVVLDFSPRKKSFLSLIPPGGNWRCLPVGLQMESMGKAFFAKGGRSGWWRRLSFDKPCPTLLTSPNHASTSLCHPTEVRALSLKEYSLIQEFPPDWKICGSKTQKYTQVGNAVPIRLARVCGDVLLKYLDIVKARNWKPFSELESRFSLQDIKSNIRIKNTERFE